MTPKVIWLSRGGRGDASDVAISTVKAEVQMRMTLGREPNGISGFLNPRQAREAAAALLAAANEIDPPKFSDAFNMEIDGIGDVRVDAVAVTGHRERGRV